MVVEHSVSLTIEPSLDWLEKLTNELAKQAELLFEVIAAVGFDETLKGPNSNSDSPHWLVAFIFTENAFFKWN